MDVNLDEITRNNVSKYSSGLEFEYLSDPFHQRRLEKVFECINRDRKLKSSYSLLSLGTGLPVLERRLKSELGITVTCTDISDNFPVGVDKDGLIWHQMDLSKKFTLEDNMFDCVYGGEIIEHLFDTRLFLSEVKRVLKPGGILLLTTPNAGSLLDRFRFLFGLPIRQINPFHKYLYLHIRPFNFSTLKNCLFEIGFDNIKLFSNYFVVDNIPKRKLVPLGINMFPSLGGTLIVQTSKLK